MILPFFLFLLCLEPAFVRGQTKLPNDTISLSVYEYAKFGTNNGSTCVYNVRNNNNADSAIVVNMGAPDSLRLDNGALFNGIQGLAPGQQLIAVGNFLGKQVTVTNLSRKPITVTVMLFCPN